MKKVLIANRGEIAVRVTRTLQQMGLTACALYSEVDQDALHVQLADEAYALGGTTSLESYLNQDKILQICQDHQIEAIHPGYGFLSENAAFARRCQQAGITFIGPNPDVIEAMGDKLNAKDAMVKAGVPVVPSFHPTRETSLEQYAEEAQKIGFPILVKAAAGGGGKGMRKVENLSDLNASLEAAQNEASKAFGDGRVFLEKYLAQPRHIEIQIFGDQHGNVVHLGERECSIQRRYQKVIEEAPSPAVSPELRKEMGETACKAARAIGYSNAGTMEFLLDESGQFYFLEVNTRLQVEHPITECVYDVDLVRAQILVAQGQPLPFQQADLQPRGWALECRLYAEDPGNHFMPCTGTLSVYEPPVGPGLRCDSGVQQGSLISVHYDPMLAKLIAFGHDREEARQRMVWALAHFPVLGLRHNLPYLKAVLEHPEFIEGKTHTHFLQQHTIDTGPVQVPKSGLVALAHFLQQQKPAQATATQATTPFQELGPWRLQ
ncbi:MAG: acetyl-CoA carboxylase biotin carboxylase subunit [Candidatus Eremiobacteraeota bacterium]|nr:acetyl-CoA carboxylase biotin carboxylase subunit [Candidatus Eremiobacteraeota bacterium]MCW5866149.1 acetyl-CoA carboxylase biotin carboxylase subunit [Candidatus Eremiobacteraeota bacterium]